MEGEYLSYFSNWNKAFYSYSKAQFIYKLLLKLKILPKSLAKKKLEEIISSISICIHNLHRTQSILRASLDFIRISTYKKQENIRNMYLKQKKEDYIYLSINCLGSSFIVSEKDTLDFFKKINDLIKIINENNNPNKKITQHLKLIIAFHSLENHTKLKGKTRLKKFPRFFKQLHNLFRTWLILNYSLNLKYYYPFEVARHWKNFKELLKPLCQRDFKEKKKLKIEMLILDSISELMIDYMIGQSHFDEGINRNAFILAHHIQKKCRRLYLVNRNIKNETLPDCSILIKRLMKQTTILQISGKTNLILEGMKAREMLNNQINNLSINDKV